MKKLQRPLGNAHFLHVAILTRLRFVDLFDLPNKRERFFRALSALRKCSGLLKCCKCKVVVTAIFIIGSTTLGMTPNPILQNVVPDISSTGFRQRRVGSHEICIFDIRVSTSIHRSHLRRKVEGRTRECFKNGIRSSEVIAQGLKPLGILALIGTTKVVP